MACKTPVTVSVPITESDDDIIADPVVRKDPIVFNKPFTVSVPITLREEETVAEPVISVLPFILTVPV
jgi:hypothetical protein